MLFAWSVLLAAGLLLAWVGASRSQHLVVLYWQRHGLVLLERRRSGQYRIFSPLLVPVVLLRYVALALASAVLGAQRRVASWSHGQGHGHRHRQTAGAKA